MQTSGNSSNISTTLGSPMTTASVILPPSLFQSITANNSDIGIFFTIYKTASLFPLANSSNLTMIASLVIGASVVAGGVSTIFSNLVVPVQLVFTIPSNVSQQLNSLSVRYHCKE